MELISTVDGHEGFVNAFVKIRTVETRIIWSYGLGDERIIVWRTESINDDMADKYAQIVSELLVLQSEVEELKYRAQAAEASKRELDALRAQELAMFQKQMDELILLCCSLAADKEQLLKELTAVKEELNALQIQNAQLRQELRAHLEKLLQCEKLMKMLVEKIDIKDDHIHRLQLDSMQQLQHLREENAMLREQHDLLLQGKTDAKLLLKQQNQLITTLRTRINELENNMHESHTRELQLRTENTDLRHELMNEKQEHLALQTKLTSELNHNNSKISELEKSVVNMVLQLELMNRENELIKETQRTTREQLNIKIHEFNTMQQQYIQLQHTLNTQATTFQQKIQSLQTYIRTLKQEIRSTVTDRNTYYEQLQLATMTFDVIARELKFIQKQLYGLKDMDTHIHMFPEAWADRHKLTEQGKDVILELPATYTLQLSHINNHIHGIIQTCFSEPQVHTVLTVFQN